MRSDCYNYKGNNRGDFKLARFEQIKHLLGIIHQVLKNTRVVKFVTTLIRKIRGEKPLDQQGPSGGDQILIHEPDPERLKSFHEQVPNHTDDDNFDTDRKIFDPVPDPEIDFSKENDLETYTKSLNVPEEVIESWVAAGILRPDEIQVAEKMLKIMRKKDSRRKKQDPNSNHN